jgi:glucokinase
MVEKNCGATPPLLRQINIKAVLETVRTSGPISRAMLAKDLGISRPTISKLVDELITEGWLLELGQGTSGNAGRKPILLEFNHRNGYILVTDLGGTEMLCGVTDLKGNFLSRVIYPSHGLDGAEAIVNALFSGMEAAVDQAGIKKERLFAVGLACPGILDKEKGIVKMAPNLKDFDRIPIIQVLRNKFQIPVIVVNDVNAATVGERWRGAGAHANNMIFLSIGTGIGAGIVINGELFEGVNGSAGEIGYLSFAYKGLGDREHGFLESVSSGYGLAKAATELNLNSSDRQKTGQPLSPTEVISLAKENNNYAKEIIEIFVENIVLAINNIVCLLNPEVIVLGGSIISHNTHLFDEIRARINSLTYFPVNLMCSALGEDGATYGVVKLALNAIMDGLSS